ncbi:MAG: hypothetical protein M1821_005059 [Bathelium mastoideum]|nr:MAG: hypothetical protein M1821_005059 [Bathelium mastoideum]
MDFTGLWSLTNDGDNGNLVETNIPLLPEGTESGTMSDMHGVQNNVAALIQSSELDYPDWPNMETSQLISETRPIVNTELGEEELSSHILAQLYQSYFDQVDASCYILNKDSFLSKMDGLSLGPELLSLKFIVLAHGASAISEYRHLQSQLYDASRKYFENAELGKSFLTIATLQACILLASYELRQLLFLRAWSSVSRAVWMAQMFGLDKMDARPLSPNQPQNVFHLGPTANPQELEERRRTFWSAFNLGSFTAMSTGRNIYAYRSIDEITTLLPIENGTPPFRSTLNNALRLSGARKFSSSAGLILISWLYGSYLRHADAALCQNQADGPNHEFWRHHYHISESVSQLISSSNMDTTLQSIPTEPAILRVKIKFQAILICLYHAAVVHEFKTNSKGSPDSESETKCFQAAMKVTNLTRQLREQADTPATSTPYILWSIYVAAQFYVRAFHAGGYRGSRPITPPTPEVYNNPWPSSAVPGNGVQGRGRNINIGSFGGHSSSSSLSSVSSHASSQSASRYDLLESISCLVSALSLLKTANPIAGVFEAQIYYELSGDKALMDNRPVGRVE